MAAAFDATLNNAASDGGNGSLAEISPGFSRGVKPNPPLPATDAVAIVEVGALVGALVGAVVDDERNDEKKAPTEAVRDAGGRAASAVGARGSEGRREEEGRGGGGGKSVGSAESEAAADEGPQPSKWRPRPTTPPGNAAKAATAYLCRGGRKRRREKNQAKKQLKKEIR